LKTVNITTAIKKEWLEMHEIQKKKYLEAYKNLFEKYEEVNDEFKKLTKPPKKVSTPYFLYFKK
jgi:hypothetical protein